MGEGTIEINSTALAKGGDESPHSTMPYARLWVQAVCGKELGLSASQRVGLLPKLVACCLRHPHADLPEIWRKQNCAAELAEPGLRLVLDLLNNCCQEDDLRWLTGLDAADRLHRLLALIVYSRWGCRDDAINPIESAELVLALAGQLNDEALLWERKYDVDGHISLPIHTEVGDYLEALLPAEGKLWHRTLSLFPMDALILQGESLTAWGCPPLPVVLLALYPLSTLPPRARLALGFYQALLLSEQGGYALFELWWLRSRLQNQSLLSQLLTTRSRPRSKSLMQSRSPSNVRSWWRLAWSSSLRHPWSQQLHTMLQSLQFPRLFQSASLVGLLEKCGKTSYALNKYLL